MCCLLAHIHSQIYVRLTKIKEYHLSISSNHITDGRGWIMIIFLVIRSTYYFFNCTFYILIRGFTDTRNRTKLLLILYKVCKNSFQFLFDLIFLSYFHFFLFQLQISKPTIKCEKSISTWDKMLLIVSGVATALKKYWPKAVFLRKQCGYL